MDNKFVIEGRLKVYTDDSDYPRKWVIVGENGFLNDEILRIAKVNHWYEGEDHIAFDYYGKVRITIEKLREE
jgi:hypothetical protein